MQKLETDFSNFPSPSAAASEPSTPILLDSPSSGAHSGRGVSFASASTGAASSGDGAESQYTRSDTMSSTGSDEKKSKHGHSLSLGHLRGAAGSAVSHKSSKSSGPPPFVLPAQLTPLSLVELALTTILTIPGYSLDELRNEIMPQLYHSAYSHRWVRVRRPSLSSLTLDLPITALTVERRIWMVSWHSSKCSEVGHQ